MQRLRRNFDSCHMTNRIRLVQYVQLPENGGWLLRKSRAPVQTLENLEMKKTLVAIAAIAAATGALAQSSVSLIGVVDAGYQAISHTDATKKWSGIKNNAVQTSRVEFVGNEDVGSGLKAGFWMELDFNPVQSTSANTTSTNAFQGTPFTGQQFVSLSGGFGELKIGQPDSPALAIGGGTMQPFGTNVGSGYSGTWGRLGTVGVSGVNSYIGKDTGRIVRHEKNIVYATPVFSGFQAKAEYSFQNDKSATVTSNDNGYYSLSGFYTNGPLNVAALTAKGTSGDIAAAGTTATIGGTTAVNNGLGTSGSVKWNMLGANYTVGAATVYAGYTTTKADNSASTQLEDSKSSSIAGKYVMGNVDLLANYIKRTNNLTTGTTPAESKLTALGANYNLSKNTALYFRNEHTTGLNTTSATQTQTINAIGMWVKF